MPQAPKIHRVSVQQFYKEAGDFLKLMGEKTFWANPEQVDLAKSAFGIVYLSTQTESDEQQQSIADSFMAIMSQFVRRQTLIEVHGLQ